LFYEEPAEYKSYLPEKLQSTVEINALDTAVRSELDNFMAEIKKNVDNKFVSTGDEEGSLRWEKLLNVTTPLNGTLQARRDALKAKLMTKPPINLQVLKGIIKAYMGLEVDISVDNFTVKVRYRGESRIKDLNPLYVTAYETIPANMLMDIAYLYLLWSETDAKNLTWVQMDAKKLTWYQWERGEWL
jgi:hypothetical protein